MPVETPSQPLDPARWHVCTPYLYGVDLFNHGYWWEAHEAWEGPWQVAGRHSEVGSFLQGLIQISVARLKWRQQLDRPAKRLRDDGLAKLERRGKRFAGLEIPSFCLQVKEFFIPRRSPAAAPPELIIELANA